MKERERRHKRSSSIVLNAVNRTPAPIAVLVGIFVGIVLARLWFGSSSSNRTNSWIPTSRFGSSRALKTGQIPLPNEAQRKHILNLLSNLSQRHTKECTKNAQPLYKKQARKRYEVLLGRSQPSGSTKSWFNYWRATDDLAYMDASDAYDEDASPVFAKRSSSGGKDKAPHKYFFAINLFNSFDVIPDIFANMFRVASIVGFENVFVSVYENGSNDQTKALLKIFDSLTRAVGMRVTIRTSHRRRGQFVHRIEYLAEVRNAALRPLYELRDSEGEVFDSIIFMNDILPCVDDLLELIWQSRRQNAGITCAADYMFHDEIAAPVFYDNWVARDINGTALENAPFEKVFHHPVSSVRFQRHLPVQVQSCWNGVAVLDPAPFYDLVPVKFRMADMIHGECSASECSLIANDYWNAGYGRIITVPRVKLAYDRRVYDTLHPKRRNLTAIRGYSRLGGLPDDPRTDPQDRSWYGPHDRLFVPEESEVLDFVPGPEYVWCWGWDGAGDLDGPDVDPIWEPMASTMSSPDSIAIKHDRGLHL